MNKIRVSAVTLALALGLSACSQKTSDEYLNSAKKRINEGNNKAAVVELKNALSQSPDMSAARLMLGEVYFEQSNFVAAEKELLRAMEQGSENSRVLPLLAQTYYYQGDYAGVIALHENHAELSEDAAQTLSLFAYVSSLRSGPEPDSWLDFPDNLTADNRLIAEAYRGLVKGKVKQAKGAIARFTEDKLKVEKDFLRGLVAFREGNFVEAARHYTDVLERIPNLHPVRFQLAEAQINAKQFELSGKTLDTLLSLGKENPYANLLKSKLLFIQQDVEGALPFAEKAIQNGMDIKLAQIIAGVSAYKLNQMESAYRYLKRASMGLGKGHDVHRLLAQVQLMLGYTEEARTTLDGLVALSDSDASLFAEAGIQMAEQGDLAAAGEYLSKANAADQNNARFRLTEGLVKLVGEDDSGIADIEAALANDSSLQQGWVLLAETYLDRGQQRQALETAKAWQQTDAASGLALQGLIHFQSGRPNDAEGALLAALAEDPEHLGANHYLAELYKQQGQFDKALEYVKNILAFAPANIPALTDWVRVKAQLDQSDEIIPGLSAHVEHYPELIEPKMVLAEYLLSVNQFSEAIVLLETERANLPVTGVMILGDAYVQARRYDDARLAFGEMREKSPRDLRGWLRSAGIEELTGQYEKALKLVDEGLERFPDNARLVLLKVDYLTKTDQLEAARLALDSAKNTSADAAVLSRLEGELALSAQRYAQAEQSLRGYYQARPDFEAAALLALALQNTDKVNEAAMLLEKELEKLSRPMMEYHSVAEFYTHNGLYAEAGKKYEQFLQHYPKHFPSLNNYANLKLKQQQYAQALVLAKKALEVAPQVPQIMDTLGWAYFKTGDLDNAERYLNEAARKLPDDLDIQMNLAEVLVAAGNAESAFTLLRQLQPVTEQQEKRLERLKAKVGGMG